MRFVEQHRHLSDDRPGLGDGGDNGLAFEDLKPPFYQHVKMPRGAALANNKRAGGYIPPNSPTAVVEKLAHSQNTPATLGSGVVVDERIMRAGCPNSRHP